MKDYNSYKGNAYGLANILSQTAFLRPKMKSKKVKGLYFTGQLTVPGPGVPPSLISGNVVSTMIVGRSKQKIMKTLFDQISYDSSKALTKAYSTSFSYAASLLPLDQRKAIYAIYSFVRVADEIVDTFHDYPQAQLLDNFERNLDEAWKTG